MIRRILVIMILAIMIFQGTALALETQGEIWFRDALYGAAIGALLGSAFYLGDQDHFNRKLATGVIIGTVGGLVYGVMETTGFVEIENDNIKFAFPTPVIEITEDGFQYSASLFKTRF